jgi:hypothetical protein
VLEDRTQKIQTLNLAHHESSVQISHFLSNLNLLLAQTDPVLPDQLRREDQAVQDLLQEGDHDLPVHGRLQKGTFLGHIMKQDGVTVIELLNQSLYHLKNLKLESTQTPKKVLTLKKVRP